MGAEAVDPAHGESLPGLRVIGTIRSPFPRPEGTPIQPRHSIDSRGEVVVDEPYVKALGDIEGFDRIWLLYWCHLSAPWRAHVIPFRDDCPHGLFATRSPSRPNPIGLSPVRLLERHGPRLLVAELDVVDGSPLLGIKPYVPDFDAHPDAKSGWLRGADERTTRADSRFRLPRRG